jgi:hypothetical protein
MRKLTKRHSAVTRETRARKASYSSTTTREQSNSSIPLIFLDPAFPQRVPLRLLHHQTRTPNAHTNALARCSCPTTIINEIFCSHVTMSPDSRKSRTPRPIIAPRGPVRWMPACRTALECKELHFQPWTGGSLVLVTAREDCVHSARRCGKGFCERDAVSPRSEGDSGC